MPTTDRTDTNSERSPVPALTIMPTGLVARRLGAATTTAIRVAGDRADVTLARDLRDFPYDAMGTYPALCA